MKTTILPFPSVSARLAELGCPFPDGLALLPTNFETASSPAEFLQVSEAATVKTLFRIANLPQSDLVPKAQRPPYIQNNSFEWVAPTIFVSAALLTDHANYVSVALSVIANYATDFFKGMSGKKTVKLEVVVEQTKTRICKRLVYEGDVDGLKEISKIVREMGDE